MRRLALLLGLLAALTAQAQTLDEPYVGQPGKDVIWVPTPAVLVEKMLDLAAVAPQDYVIDLGSGDGRNIIAAARRGARGLGVEFDPALVELSRRSAAAAGVADRARFVEGDLFEADISQATVLALFLLPETLHRLKPRLARLQPGTRIVTNTFPIDGWRAKQTATLQEGCGYWCKAYLYVIPRMPLERPGSRRP